MPSILFLALLQNATGVAIKITVDIVIFILNSEYKAIVIRITKWPETSAALTAQKIELSIEQKIDENF